ncbi:hypothetical protein TYRP_020106 [Tyrophagus putrescentiae]|nr:hypothetical protein TYRP_020106 [Tyrophagus putrescentiae]
MLGLEYQWALANGAPLMCSSIVPSAPLLTPGLSVSGRLASPLGANRKSNCPFLPSLPFSSFSFWQQQQHAASFPSLLLSFIIFTQHVLMCLILASSVSWAGWLAECASSKNSSGVAINRRPAPYVSSYPSIVDVIHGKHPSSLAVFSSHHTEYNSHKH